jgi:hypothetical protein
MMCPYTHKSQPGSTGLSQDGRKKNTRKRTIQIKKKDAGKLVKRIPLLGEAVTGKRPSKSQPYCTTLKERLTVNV